MSPPRDSDDLADTVVRLLSEQLTAVLTELARSNVHLTEAVPEFRVGMALMNGRITALEDHRQDSGDTARAKIGASAVVTAALLPAVISAIVTVVVMLLTAHVGGQ